ncbi:MAG: ATP-dependent Clp protease ATP-binding subunit [Planctomycetes bacterium]|nr:ATP-dependent Clp protease ATP-binding subunit [Planctomycetota bacterium]
MNITIPIYVHSHRESYTVRPLFFSHPVAQHEKLERVLHLLARDLRKELRHLGKQLRHDELSAYTFCPDLDYHRIDLILELRKRVGRGCFFFVTFHALGRRLAFAPSLPEVWSELARGETLHDRATEVLTAHFRTREKEDEDDFIPPEQFALQGTAWVTTLDLDIHPARVLESPEDARRAALGDSGTVDGERELFRVGRCLDQLYPDDLDRVLLRDREVEELTRLLRAADRRPVLLMGTPLVGKTAILHEYVFRTVAQRKDPHRIKNNVWLLSPQRLISGMSYVGQWENRLLAILKEVKKRNHLLYFDDFLGLYYAGQTCQSDLSVAHVLKPYIERRDVRLVAEMTPEVFRVLRERDRGFADLFHVLPVHEPTERDNLRIQIAVMRQLEGQHRCRFALDVLPAVLDLQRRYVRHLSFPGKAAMFLRRLAVKFRRGDISRDAVLAEFHAQSGLALSFLDTRTKLDPQEVTQALERQVIGQPAALQAAANVVSIAKARLNDPERPLASFLFLGPTGVGKTQCAKALATYLFGDTEKLVRFDMNEFIEPGAAARLVGTFYSPEGLLTAAVRRQPFAVVLLDEIEKAHPEVSDLLLQVLGEGRLTDALGRTVDFSNTIIILTSNLGVREAQSSLGYQAEDGHNREVYALAAERFFRPEFFNRLDRIVPFDRLGREDVGRIARLLIRDLFQREGLLRRKSILRIDERALDRVVDQGFDSVLGARALKRALERQLTQPISARLAEGVHETLTVVGVYPSGNGLAVDVRGLAQAERSAEAKARESLRDVPAVLERIKVAADRIDGQLAPLRPHGEITAASLAGEHLRYFTLQERLQSVRDRVRALADRLEAERRSAQGIASLNLGNLPRKSKLTMSVLLEGDCKRNILREMAAAQDIHLFVEDLVADSVACSEGEAQEILREAINELSLLHLAMECADRKEPEQAVVYLWSSNRPDHRPRRGMEAGTEARFENLFRTEDEIDRLAAALQPMLEGHGGLEAKGVIVSPDQAGEALVVRGLTAVSLARVEEGTHLFSPLHGGLVLIQVHVWPVPDGVSPEEVLREKLDARQRWQQELAEGHVSVDDDPFRLLPVLRIYNEDGTTVDLCTGLLAKTMPPLGPFVVGTLPLPPELR